MTLAVGILKHATEMVAQMLKFSLFKDPAAKMKSYRYANRTGVMAIHCLQIESWIARGTSLLFLYFTELNQVIYRGSDHTLNTRANDS